MEVDNKKAQKGKVYLLVSLGALIVMDFLVAFIVPDLTNSFFSRLVIIGLLFGLTYYGFSWARVAFSVFLILYAITVLLIASSVKDFFLLIYSVQLLLMAALLHTSGFLKQFFLMRNLKRTKGA